MTPELSVERVLPNDFRSVRAFVEFPWALYDGDPRWVPPLFRDARLQLDRGRNPFFEHSDAEFFIARRGGRVVGRLAVLENRRFNICRSRREAHFTLFDCTNDAEAAQKLFDEAEQWASDRDLKELVGPRGMGALDGYGILTDGYNQRQMMTMSAYNYDYYADLIEGAGFRKAMDYVSWRFHLDELEFPSPVRAIARRARDNARFSVKRFRSKKELRDWIPRIGEAYNSAFAKNWEFYPLSETDLQQLADAMLPIVQLSLFKVFVEGSRVTGFLFAFPDVSAGLQKARGRLFPLGLLQVVREVRKTRWLSLNGIGILPELQGRGGNAVLYMELAESLRQANQFEYVEVTQVAETAEQMMRDLERLGARPHKRHRVYTRRI